MCGIIGYVGNREASQILFDGLKRLEYRGYDSSGIGIIPSTNGRIVLLKSPGKLKSLQELMISQPFPHGTVGISHTRWATHGAPNRVNAHPHMDCTGKFLVVHNGIIENYEVLKKDLQSQGHHFTSQTDTEVVAHLIESYYRNSKDFAQSVIKAVSKLKGSFALGIICSDYPDQLIGVRVGSPLIVGLGNKENFIASDVPAILEHTKRIIYLKDYQWVHITGEKVKVYSFDGKAVTPKIDIIKFKLEDVQKQGFAHFMLKEIHEQPECIAQMLKTRIKNNRVTLDGLNLNDSQLKKISNIIIVACGTAYHAGLVGRYILESLCSIPVSVDVSSEFRYRNPIIRKDSLVLAISQSGETADTLAAVKEAKSKRAKVIAICNVVGSTLTREADGVLYTHAGPEIGVASTKAYTAQLMMLYLLSIRLASAKRSVHSSQIKEAITALKQIPHLYKKILDHKKDIAHIAQQNSHFGCFLFLGRNVNYPTALEGALKLKEISYIPAEGYAAGEMKHGPIALIDEYRAVVCIAPQSDVYEKMISNIQEIRSRRGKVIAIATEGDHEIKKHAEHVIYIPKTDASLTPLTAVLPLQLLAYYISVKRGCDVDQPRNLAKSVTVE